MGPAERFGKAWEPLPLLLVDGLLPHGHVLRVLLQAVQRRLRLQADPVVVIFGIPPGNINFVSGRDIVAPFFLDNTPHFLQHTAAKHCLSG